MSYIYKRVNSSDLFHDLQKMGRADFSYEGAQALMEYLEEITEGTGEAIEYDPIAYCCEFAEYASLQEFNKGYSKEYKSWDDVENETQVIRLSDDAAIVQSF